MERDMLPPMITQLGEIHEAVTTADPVELSPEQMAQLTADVIAGVSANVVAGLQGLTYIATVPGAPES
jgi:hypothetical protein